jgi:hypothetical protein
LRQQFHEHLSPRLRARFGETLVQQGQVLPVNIGLQSVISSCGIRAMLTGIACDPPAHDFRFHGIFLAPYRQNDVPRIRTSLAEGKLKRTEIMI